MRTSTLGGSTPVGERGNLAPADGTYYLLDNPVPFTAKAGQAMPDGAVFVAEGGSVPPIARTLSAAERAERREQLRNEREENRNALISPDLETRTPAPNYSRRDAVRIGESDEARAAREAAERGDTSSASTDGAPVDTASASTDTDAEKAAKKAAENERRREQRRAAKAAAASAGSDPAPSDTGGNVTPNTGDGDSSE